MQHGTQLRHRIHASDAQAAHVGQQLREPFSHVGSFKAARLPLIGNCLQRLLHLLGVGDLSVLPQGVDHLRRIDTVRPLAHDKLGRDRCIFQGLAQLHTGANQLVDHVGDVVARHAGVTRSVDDLARHLLFLRLIGNAGLDRDVTNNGAKVRADLRRNGQHTDTHDSGADRAFHASFTRIKLLMPLGFKLGFVGRLPHGTIGFLQTADLDPLLFQAVEVGVQPAEQFGRPGSTTVVGLFPFIAQANGVANRALQHTRLVAFCLKALDPPRHVLERSTDRRTDGAADH